MTPKEVRAMLERNLDVLRRAEEIEQIYEKRSPVTGEVIAHPDGRVEFTTVEGFIRYMQLTGRSWPGITNGEPHGPAVLRHEARASEVPTPETHGPPLEHLTALDTVEPTSLCEVSDIVAISDEGMEENA